MPLETFFNLPEDKRRRVVAAALDEFAEHTYDTASISRICVRAEIAKGSFYHYFSSKIDLFEWLTFEELGRQKIAFVQANVTLPTDGDFFATMEGYAVAGYRWALANPRLARITEALMSPSPDPDLQALAVRHRRMGHQGMTTMLRAGQASGHVRADLDLEIAASVLVVLLQQGADRALWQRFGLDLVGLMRRPERACDVTEAELHTLVSGLVDILRRGFGSASGSREPVTFDIEKLADDIYRSTS
jgi:AcrR family transcriptional regulator